MTKGISLVELLLVIALIILISASSTPFLSRFILQAHLDSTTKLLAGSLIKAQAYAMDGKNNENWGICQSGNTIRLYSGSCNSPNFSEAVTVPSTINITNLADTSFSKRGEPSQALSIVISTSIETTTLTLNTAGGLDVE